MEEPTVRKITLTLTAEQFDALTAACDYWECYLDDEYGQPGIDRQRNALNAAWRKLRRAWRGDSTEAV